MSLNFSRASRMALYAGDAENLFTAIVKAEPPTPRGVPVLPVTAVAPMAIVREGDWAVEGQLRCDDDLSFFQRLRQLIGAGENNYFYGFLLRRLTPDPAGDFDAGDYLAIVRGTMQPIEWVLDLLAAPDLLAAVEHSSAGLVPSGFFSIYNSMSLVTPNGRSAGAAARAIGDIVNQDNRRVTVVGHSLGAVLGVYLMSDLASEVSQSITQLDAYLIACPQPGTDDFVARFRQQVGQYNVVNWWRDIVPEVPPLPFKTLLNGSPQQNVVRLMPDTPGIGPLPADNPGENHNADNYALMLDRNSALAQSIVQWRKDNPGKP